MITLEKLSTLTLPILEGERDLCHFRYKYKRSIISWHPSGSLRPALLKPHVTVRGASMNYMYNAVPRCKHGKNITPHVLI